MGVKVSRSVSTPVVTAQGERLVSHAGVGMLAETADLWGLTAGISRLFTGHGHVWRASPATGGAGGTRRNAPYRAFCTRQ